MRIKDSKKQLIFSELAIKICIFHIGRELRHPNLCQFVGACTETPNVCILMEYCPKGALADVLLNDDIPLTWSFRFSFAADIANGMDYLHSHGLVHARLNSSNCVVDDRWSVKITGMSLGTTWERSDWRWLEPGSYLTVKVKTWLV